MKKLFVSVPMRGRTKENIMKSIEVMHKMAELHFGEELEVIDSYIPGEPESTNVRVWKLGKSIQMMSDADCIAAVSDMYRVWVME